MRSISGRNTTFPAMRSCARASYTRRRRSSNHGKIMVSCALRYALFSVQLTNVSIAVFGLKATMESIDNRSDFKIWMNSYAYAHGALNRGPRRTGPQEEGFVSAARLSPKTTSPHGSRGD